MAKAVAWTRPSKPIPPKKLTWSPTTEWSSPASCILARAVASASALPPVVLTGGIMPTRTAGGDEAVLVTRAPRRSRVWPQRSILHRLRDQCGLDDESLTGRSFRVARRQRQRRGRRWLHHRPIAGTDDERSVADPIPVTPPAGGEDNLVARFELVEIAER